MRPPFPQRRVADYAMRPRIEEDALIDLQWVAAARFAGITVGIAMFFLFAALMSFLVGCNSATPTLHGVTVKSETVAAAAKVERVADVAAATVAKGITAGLASGIIKPDVARVYAEKIGPKVQASLDGLRRLLVIAGQKPNETTTEKLQEAAALLQEAIATAQEFLANPTAVAAREGALP